MDSTIPRKPGNFNHRSPGDYNGSPDPRRRKQKQYEPTTPPPSQQDIKNEATKLNVPPLWWAPKKAQKKPRL